MVPITSQSTALDSYRSNPLISTFADFIYSNENDLPALDVVDWNDANQIAMYAAAAVSQMDKDAFERAYERISKRTPSKQANWIYNDLIFFPFVVGVKTFNVDDTWLRDTLHFIEQNTSDELLTISQTLLDVLQDNYNSTSNYHPIVIVSRHLLNLPQTDEDRLIKTFENLSRGSHSDSTFINIINIRAIEVIVRSKGLVDHQRQVNIEEFVRNFFLRSQRIARGVVRFVFLLLLLPISYSIYLIEASPVPIDPSGGWLTILGLLLSSIPLIVGVISPPDRIVRRFQQMIWKIGGYIQGQLPDLEEQ